MTPEARLDVGVVGPGRAGTALAMALARAGHQVVAAHAVSEASRRRVGEQLSGAVLVDVAGVFALADLVLLTVPDDALAALVRAVADNGWVRRSQFVVHTSGRFGAGILDPLAAQGALPLALHPVMTLNGSSMDVERLIGCPFGVTASEELLPVAEALVMEMGGEPMRVDEDRRGLYHAALAHGANHLVTLVNDAAEVLGAAGVAAPQEMLRALLAAALDNSLRFGDRGLTGPVSRGDAGTVAAHLASLELVSPHIAASYRAMARRTADRAMSAGLLEAADAVELVAVLAD